MRWKLTLVCQVHTAEKTLDKNSINLSMSRISNAVQYAEENTLLIFSHPVLHRRCISNVECNAYAFGTAYGNPYGMCMQNDAIEICKFVQARNAFFFLHSIAIYIFLMFFRTSLKFIHSIHRPIIYTAVHNLFSIFFSASTLLCNVGWRNDRSDVAKVLQ